jgi:hypothetical protein
MKSAMRNRITGYISVYNDWDLLEPSLKSVAPYLDELVVVDGAYSWMDFYYRTTGENPERSNEKVYDAIEASKIPYRVLSRTWANELEKRKAGYIAASDTRFVFRIDADEILFVDAGAFERFFSSNIPVGEMEMPMFVAPGHIRARKGVDRIERQCFLFDSKHITPDTHLAYLWLVLTADDLPNEAQATFPVFGEPLAFNAHLTIWRTPETAVNRAAFYTLNYMRKHGVPWLPELRGKPLSDVSKLFTRVSPKVYLDILKSSLMVSGHNVVIDENFIIKKSPLSRQRQNSLKAYYDRFLSCCAANTTVLIEHERHFIRGWGTYLDLTRDDVVAAICKDDMLILKFSADVAAAKVKLVHTTTDAPYQVTSELPYEIAENQLQVTLPREAPPGLLRRNLEFQVWANSPEPIQTFRIVR